MWEYEVEPDKEYSEKRKAESVKTDLRVRLVLNFTSSLQWLLFTVLRFGSVGFIVACCAGTPRGVPVICQSRLGLVCFLVHLVLP